MMTTCRFEMITNGERVVPRTCPICGLGKCSKGLLDPYVPNVHAETAKPERPKQSDADFLPGQVVQLRSGGPLMTVERVSPGDPFVTCVWLQDSGHLSRAPFVAVTLIAR